MQEELGIDSLVTFCTSFVYRTAVTQGMIEHEFDHLFVGRYIGSCAPDPNEVAAVRWWTREEIQEQLQHSPQIFAPWFPFIVRQIAYTTAL
jgi:isopentenyl-diphosphate delta-isomerase